MRPPHLDARALAHLTLLLLLACSGARPITKPSPSPSPSHSPTVAPTRRVLVMSLTSPSIFPGRPVPAHNSCRTDDYSPELRWTPGPSGTVEYALIVDDPDVSGRPFTMWTVWDIAVRFRVLPENHVTPGAQQGRNDDGTVAYSGPCFPERASHRYRWTIYALSARPALQQGALPGDVRAAIAPLVIGFGTLVAKGY